VSGAGAGPDRGNKGPENVSLGGKKKRKNVGAKITCKRGQGSVFVEWGAETTRSSWGGKRLQKREKRYKDSRSKKKTMTTVGVCG